MSKKNNKNRSKAYAEFLKEQEKKEEERRRAKMERRDVNRITSSVLDEINEISLTVEKEDKMEIEPKVSKSKPKKVAKKHKLH
jgi:hypothetical protein